MSEKHEPFYYPGEEPEEIREQLDMLFSEIREIAPNWIIRKSEWDHSWDKTAGYLCKLLGYSRGTDFLKAYGFSIIDDLSMSNKTQNPEKNQSAIPISHANSRSQNEEREKLELRVVASPKWKRNSRKRILAVLLVLVILCTVGFGIYLFLQSTNSGNYIPSYESDLEFDKLMKSVNITSDQKVEATLSVLQKLKNKGYILDFSECDPSTKSIEFIYADTTLGEICFKEPSDDTFGNKNTNNDYNVSSIISGLHSNEYASPDDLNIILLDAAGMSDVSECHTQYVETLREKGVNVTYDNDVTVEDVGELNGYDVVVINAHGTISNGNPAFTLLESVTNEKNEKYSRELTIEHSIKAVTYIGDSIFDITRKYTILPDFLTQKYGSSGINAKLTFLMVCSSFGEASYGSQLNNANYSLADAILGNSQNCCIGFYNSVAGGYALKTGYHVIDAMVSGSTSGSALLECIDTYGANDRALSDEVNPGGIYFRGNYDVTLFDNLDDNIVKNEVIAKPVDYLQILFRQRNNMLNYSWQTIDGHIAGGRVNHPIAVHDIAGDERPELIFLSSSQTGQANLIVYGYSGMDFKKLYDEPFDISAASGTKYYLFTVSGDKSLYGYTSISDLSCWKEFIRFDYNEIDNSIDKTVICNYVFLFDDVSWSGEDFYYIDEVPASEEQYNDYVLELLKNMQQILIHGEVDMELPIDGQGMSFEEAADYFIEQIAAEGGNKIENEKCNQIEASRVRPNGAFASSEILFNQPPLIAERAIDGDIVTSWQENVDGYGEGQFLTLFFNYPIYFSGMEIYIGACTSVELYNSNGKPKTIRLDFSSGDYTECVLDNTMNAQYIRMKESVQTTYVKISIIDTYPGSQWDDTAISEIIVCGSAVISGIPVDYLPVSNQMFNFASGVGGWHTELTLESDGSFKGIYNEQDMNLPGVRECNFSGRFKEFQKIDDTRYFMKLEYINYDGPYEAQYNGQYYIAPSESAYGIDGGDSFFLYLPGTPTSILPSEYLTWVSMPNAWRDVPEQLPFYGLFNADAEVSPGFYS